MLLPQDGAWAQVVDPTRPPGAAAGGASATGTTGQAELPQGVQAIFLRNDGKSSALVNGMTVRVGDTVDGKKVVRISERAVVLQTDAGRETMDFYPAVDKTFIKTRPEKTVDGNLSKETRK